MECQLAALCDAANMSANGKLNILGEFDRPVGQNDVDDFIKPTLGIFPSFLNCSKIMVFASSILSFASPQ